MNLLIHGYKLELTCRACPEQYDVLDDEGNMVAYLRLRHGSFTAECPDVGGTVVFNAYPNGDGIFEDDERFFHLQESITRIQKWIISDKFKAEYE